MAEEFQAVEAAPFKYKWRQLGRSGEKCFGARDGKLSIGWFEQITWGPYAGEWRWHFGDISAVVTRGGRMGGTARDVARHIEGLYDYALPRSSSVGLNLEDQIEHYRQRGLPVPSSVNWQRLHCRGIEFKIVGVHSVLW